MYEYKILSCETLTRSTTAIERIQWQIIDLRTYFQELITLTWLFRDVTLGYVAVHGCRFLVIETFASWKGWVFITAFKLGVRSSATSLRYYLAIQGLDRALLVTFLICYLVLNISILQCT